MWDLERGLSSGGTWDFLLCSMWNLPRPSIEPVSLALADGFLITGSPGKSQDFLNEKSNALISILDNLTVDRRFE